MPFTLQRWCSGVLCEQVDATRERDALCVSEQDENRERE
jgi:hypothetical protein